MPLCNICSEVLRQDVGEAGPLFGHHPTLASLVSAVDEQGCRICAHYFTNLTSCQQAIMRTAAAAAATGDTPSEEAQRLLQTGTLPLGPGDFSWSVSEDGEFISFSTTTLHSEEEEAAYQCKVEELTRLWRAGQLPAEPRFYTSIRLAFLGEISVFVRVQLLDAAKSWLDSQGDSLSARHGSKLVRVDPRPLKRGSSLEPYIPEPSRPTIPPTSSYTGSDETWAVVRGWLDHCAARHRCLDRIGTDVSWYPTRLLDVSDAGTFRVIESAEEMAPASTSGAPSRYVTLSHRWGVSGHILRLTTENRITLRSEGMPVSILSQTFQEAIAVARRMGIFHIWIDSLCIIQSGDDGQDWLRESAVMEKVYSNSFCNIAADWGSERSGLFFQRDPRLWEEVAVGVKSAKHLLTDDMVAFRLEDRSDWDDEVIDAPLNERGWVLQERLLSPRVLHFGRTQVSWECRHGRASETWPASDSSSVMARETEEPISPFGRSRPEFPPTYAGASPFTSANADRDAQAWWDVVKLYSFCVLTRRTDVLVAVAGVARKMKQTVPARRDDLYVAGIWRSNMVAEMAWQITMGDRGVRKPRPVGYRAPSFSWASTDNSFEPKTEPGGELVSASCVKYRAEGKYDVDEPLEDDLFGPLFEPSVEIKVTGFLQAALLVRDREEGQMLSNSAWWLQLGGGRSMWASLDFAVKEDGWYDDPGTEGGEEAAELSERWWEESEVFVMPWQVTSFEKCVCLVLELENEAAARFRRIGLAKLDLERKDILCDPEYSDPNLPSQWFDEGTGEHTIYIV